MEEARAAGSVPPRCPGDSGKAAQRMRLMTILQPWTLQQMAFPCEVKSTQLQPSVHELLWQWKLVASLRWTFCITGTVIFILTSLCRVLADHPWATGIVHNIHTALWELQDCLATPAMSMFSITGFTKAQHCVRLLVDARWPHCKCHSSQTQISGTGPGQPLLPWADIMSLSQIFEIGLNFPKTRPIFWATHIR